jgi:anti-anti-sigma factor
MSAGSEAMARAMEDFRRKHANCELSFRESERPRGLEIAVRGELDSNDAHDFQEITRIALAEAKDRGGLVVELSGLTYISSMGIGVLVSTLTESRIDAIPLYLANLSDNVKEIMSLLGFLSLFELVEKTDAA